MKLETLKVILKTLLATTPQSNRQLSDELVDAWVLSLSDLPDVVAKQGLKHCLQKHTSGFLPTPAEFRQYCLGSKEEKSGAAWAQLLSAVKRYGSWSAIEFEDSAIAEAVRRMGGWRRICHSEERELGFLKREFQENYNQTTGGDYPAIVGSGDVRLIKAPATNNLLLN